MADLTNSHVLESEPVTPADPPREVRLDPSFFDTDFVARTTTVRLLETEAFRKKKGELQPDHELVVTIRALTSDQYFKAKVAGDQADDWKKLRDVFLEKTQQTVAPELKKALADIEQSVGKETVFRIELILRATIDAAGRPLFTRGQVVNLAEFFSQDFMQLSNAILDLMGEGPSAGE